MKRIPFVAPLLIVVVSLGLAPLSAAPELGLQSWTLREMDFEEAVMFAKQHDIKHVQFFRKHIDPTASKGKLLEQKAFLDAHDVKAYSIGVSRTTMDPLENRLLFETAKIFGMEVIVVEPRDLAQWDVLEPLVKEYDIKLAVHNHGTGTVYGNPSTVKHILAARDERIGVCMDIGWVTAAGFDAAEIYRNYGGRVFDMHLKDKVLDPRNPDVKPTDTHIGLGSSNYDELFDLILADDWMGVMAIETDSKEFAADPTEFVTRAKAFFEAHVAGK